MVRPSDLRRAYYEALDRPYYEPLELDDDIRIVELVHALVAAGLTLRNVPGRGLRIVRAPTPGEEARNVD